MEVTRTNFQEVLKELEGVLENAAFLCIDGEFTGLNSGPDASALDSPAQYYSKIRFGSMDFILVQFGLSVFTYNQETKKYTQNSYNFYVFPQPLNRAAPDCKFLCQASSMYFLANQGFDFNKLFKCGIPYLTQKEEVELLKKLEEKQKMKDEQPECIPIPDEDKARIEEICSRVEEFLNSEDTEMIIDRCNAFIRRLIHQEVRKKWPNRLKVESQPEGFSYGQNVLIRKIKSEEEEKQKDLEQKDKELLELQNAVGLSLLLRMIAKSGKLLIGHNMFLDICHIVNQFFHPLPKNYQEFKNIVHSLFPRLLDTKVICQNERFKETVLSSNLNVLLETVSKTPFSIPEVECPVGRSYSVSDNKAHEAGYDAYITGLCFIALFNYLDKEQISPVPTILDDSAHLKPFMNKLVIPRLKDVPHIDLIGEDSIPSRDHVFHVIFPKETTFKELRQLFFNFGHIQVSWITDTSAYVALHKREQAKRVMKNIKKSSVYKVQTYAKHQAFMSKMNVKNDALGAPDSAISNSTNKLTPESGVVSSEMMDDTTNEIENEDTWKLATGKRKRKRKVQSDDDENEEQAGEQIFQKKSFPENDSWN